MILEQKALKGKPAFDGLQIKPNVTLEQNVLPQESCAFQRFRNHWGGIVFFPPSFLLSSSAGQQRWGGGLAAL